MKSLFLSIMLTTFGVGLNANDVSSTKIDLQ